ncbi:MAG: ABC transporter ATP-binding protein [Nannocystaceae bacterium]|jgi:ABC-2 type transport system ATP-binding protein
MTVVSPRASAAAAPLVSLRGVRKRFGSFTALHDISADIEGRAIGLLGPNGAGKTTLIRVLLGLLAPDGGQALVLGHDVRVEPAAVRARVGYAMEGPDRIGGLSGLESVVYAGELCGLRRRAAILRAHEILDLVGLDDARMRPVEEYSTGMHQRVKLAMALVHDPELLLLDEPTSGLDPESREELLDLIVRLRDGEGPAVILSTHLLHDVERTCDAAVIMHQGQVRFAGPLAQLKVTSSRSFEVELDGDATAFAAALQHYSGVMQPGRRPGAWIVTLAVEDSRSLWWAANAAGVRLYHVQRHEASLEEAFLSAVAATPGAA